MKFFRKSTPEKADKPAQAEAVMPGRDLTAEEAARQWFANQFGTDMPDEMVHMLREMARAEAKRQKAGEVILDDNELKRIQDSMKLNKTKLANICQTLAGLQAQKDWIHKFKELNARMEKFKQAFFVSNKEYSAHLHEIRELERFEAFEEVVGDYQAIKVLEANAKGLRAAMQEQSARLAESREAAKEAQKTADNEHKRLQEAQQHMQQTLALLPEGYRLVAAIEAYEADTRDLAAYKEHIEQAWDEAQKLEQETAEELKRHTGLAAQQQQTQQNLEPQQKMLEKGDVIQVRLAFLQNRRTRREQLQTDLERMLRKQHEQDEKLNKLFTTSQEIDAQIKTLQSELQVHLKSIVGMNSYNLQQRAMDLKSKMGMLRNAATLWEQITNGYGRVDEKSQEIMRRRLHNEALKQQIEQLEPITVGLRKQCEELDYAYTLSKSQDVMQLRKDLLEGVACSVCGATHHPFHSDTLLEQSKLIGEMKRDLEQTATELKHKQAQLEELKRQQVAEESQIELSYKTLETYKEILQANVAHWEDFVELDRSFKDCSASTNFEGRRIMLQQLIEKTGLDAEYAQQELDTFNFHQSNINSLNEAIAHKEQEKNDIAVRLNEVNTGCQVVAYRVEQLQEALSRTNSKYSELFDEIDKMMAIANWHKVWVENPETLRVYIQQQMERWFQLKKDMAATKAEIARLQTQLDMAHKQTAYLGKQLDIVTGKLEQLEELQKQMRERLSKTFPDNDVEGRQKEAYLALCEALERKDAAARQSGKADEEAAMGQGYNQRMADALQELDGESARRRSDLDVWIRKYNANHSPVQFPELEQTFNSGINWNKLRETARKLTLQNMLAEAKADEARMALAAHQVNALTQGAEKEDRTAALNTEIARLENERERTLVKIASSQAQIEAHELGLQKLAANADSSKTT